MKPEPKDTFTTAANNIRLAILARAPGLGARARAALERELADGGDRYSYVELERAGTSTTLHVDTTDRWRQREPVLNAAGDEFWPVQFKFDVNWPCHGSCDPATALARLEFYRQVAFLAAELGAEFGGEFWQAGRTAAQAAADNAKEAAAKQAARVRAVVEANKKGLRIGGMALLPAAPADLPDGEYDCTAEGRCYRLIVKTENGARAAMVGRIADPAPESAPCAACGKRDHAAGTPCAQPGAPATPEVR